MTTDSDVSSASNSSSAIDKTKAKSSESASRANTKNFDVTKFEAGSSKELLRLAAVKFRAEEINEKVKAYEPTDRDIYENLANDVYMRRIYSGMKLREREQRGVEEFRAWLVETGKEIPLGMTDHHYFDLRFLNLSDYDHEIAYKELWLNDKWLRERIIPLFEDPGKYLKLAN